MNQHNILIIKLSSIGDVIHALPVATALKKEFPHARITWVVEPPAYDLLTNNPNIDEILVFEKNKFKTLSGFLQHAPSFIRALRERQFNIKPGFTGLFKGAAIFRSLSSFCQRSPGLARNLRERQFSIALDLQGLFKSAAISFLSGASQRLVYCNAREYSDVIGKRVAGPHSTDHIVQRYLDVARELGCQIDQPEFVINITEKEGASADAIAKQAGLDLHRRYVVLIPGTNWPNKCWPAEHFAELAGNLFVDQLIPVFVGSHADKMIMKEIYAKSEIPPIDLTGKTSLKQLAHIIKKAQAVVAGDTGPMHLAAALNIPVIALFGPTFPARNGPYGEGHTVLTVRHPCSGCWQRQCPKGKECLADISVATVYDAVKKTVADRGIN